MTSVFGDPRMRGARRRSPQAHHAAAGRSFRSRRSTRVTRAKGGERKTLGCPICATMNPLHARTAVTSAPEDAAANFSRVKECTEPRGGIGAGTVRFIAAPGGKKRKNQFSGKRTPACSEAKSGMPQDVWAPSGNALS